MLAIRNDEELDKLLGNGAFPPTSPRSRSLLTCVVRVAVLVAEGTAIFVRIKRSILLTPATFVPSGGVLPNLQPALLPGQHPRLPATPRTPKKSGESKTPKSAGGTKKAPFKPGVQAESQWQESVEL